MYDLIIIGAGPAGLSAAVNASEAGLKKILLIERDSELGGILNQCIHNGFGLHMFREELTGPEFAGRFIDMLRETEVEVLSDTMVLDLDHDHNVHILNKNGYQTVKGQAIILAMGCRERTRGAIAIPGTRAAGVFTAGAAQRYMNMDGYSVGKRVVILGSGDIGLIMARRMTLEGARVLACLEIMPYSSGLQRNIKQCLEDFDIPLYLSHTVTDIKGEGRINQVVASAVDEKMRPIPGSEMYFDCDTLLLSVGLIPENELSKGAGIELDRKTRGPVVYENMETSIPGIFACGNVVQVHDLADNVAMEAKKAALAAARYIREKPEFEGELAVKTEGNVTYTVPQHIHTPVTNPVEICFRTNRVFARCNVLLKDADGEVIHKAIKPYITPGELQKIMVPARVLENKNGCITITVTEVE